MHTRLVNEWKVPTDQLKSQNLMFAEACEYFISKDISRFLSDERCDSKNTTPNKSVFSILYSEYQKVTQELNELRWVRLAYDIYFDKEMNGCWLLSENKGDNLNSRISVLVMKLDMYSDTPSIQHLGDVPLFSTDLYKRFDSGTPLLQVEQHINEVISDPINQWTIPTLEQLKSITKSSIAPFAIINGTDSFLEEHQALFRDNDSVNGFYCNHQSLLGKDTGYSIPFLSLSNKRLSPRELFITLLKKGLTPSELEHSSNYQLLLHVFHRKMKGVFTAQQPAAEQLLQCQYSAEITAILLNEDKVRADIAPYHKKMLLDTEQGHWSLWEGGDQDISQECISSDEKLVARNPNADVNNGVVGIDFGTKSTVVVYQKDNVNIHPMRIGTGDLSKEMAAFHYENPTIMEFNDLERFITDYHAKANKPYTRWQDLTISHTAKNAMHGCQSNQFNTFLDEIKQWAGDKNRKLKVVGKQGKVIDLPPFLDIGEDDFNPIEIYAYYLGLYINNHNNGIYLDYILSFPVTYEMPIRDKIIASFENGLQKSLPAELGEETLAKLTVTKGASEPAAYALVALQAYNFDPCDDDRVFYSVFDFGGGTTDFDFGVFRAAKGKKERRFDYVIEHFGAGGDRYLGGENLLELLAFEIFKQNKATLLASGIQFEKHPEKDVFAGSEQLLSASQEAKVNTKTLCEMLRPFWECCTESNLSLDQGSISINLTDLHAIVHTAFELDIDEDKLNTILHDRIEQGVTNFFEALRLAFSNSKTSLQDIDSIKIFLAGNSSQSHFVQEIFKQQIAQQNEEIECDITETEENYFELFKPLGADKSDVEKPTGKTGVAFGLIEAREGGSILVIDHNVTQDDIRFKYYLGESRKKCFKAIINRETNFNEWVEFIDASCEKFELFYTDQPIASTGTMPISNNAIKKKVIKLDITDEDAMVYLRIVSPTTIEFVIAHENDISNNQYLTEIQYIELA
ncbi:MAG: hypothetical protein JJV99_11745 [Colwellia sp.]|nr:hypothetical protein [Colwellia sp.]